MSAPVLERRARLVRSQARVRRWEYRQRHHAKGTWLRLARLLVDAQRAFVVSEEDSATLEAEGFTAEAAGAEIEPAKTLRFVPSARAALLASGREIPVRFGPDFLAARHVVLVGFVDGPR